MDLSDKGRELPRIEKLVSQEQIKWYAQASGDFNPVHLDEKFAATTTFGRIIAHGMLILAFLSEMMTMAYSDKWLEGGRLKVRFKAPVFPGDTVTTFGTMKDIQKKDGVVYAAYVVGCRNQRGEEVITGEAWAPLR